MGHIPAELDAVEVEFGIAAAFIAHGGAVGVVVAVRFGSVRAVGIDVGAVCVGHHSHGKVFVHMGRGGKVDVLVRGVNRAEVAIEITAVVGIDGAVEFNFGSEGKRCRCKYDGQNEFAHKILLKMFRA